MAKKTLYGFIRKCMADGIKKGEVDRVMKAATDYQLSGALEPTDAVNLFDTVRSTSNVVSQMRIVEASSNLVDLNQFVNEGVLVGRAGAATAKAAILAGNNVAGIEKGNIGNEVTLKEFYFLFSRIYEELTNLARLGSAKFNAGVNKQFQTSYKKVLENMVWNGDNTANEPLGLLVDAKANIGSGATGKTVRNVDTASITTVLESLRALRDISSVDYRDELIYFTSVKDLDKYRDEIGSSSSFSTDKLIVENKDMVFDGRPIVTSPYIPEGNYIASPWDNMALVLNIINMGKDIELQKVPASMLYSIVSFWQFKFITFDKVSIAYAQS